MHKSINLNEWRNPLSISSMQRYIVLKYRSSFKFFLGSAISCYAKAAANSFWIWIRVCLWYTVRVLYNNSLSLIYQSNNQLYEWTSCFLLYQESYGRFDRIVWYGKHTYCIKNNKPLSGRTQGKRCVCVCGSECMLNLNFANEWISISIHPRIWIHGWWIDWSIDVSIMYPPIRSFCSFIRRVGHYQLAVVSWRVEFFTGLHEWINHHHLVRYRRWIVCCVMAEQYRFIDQTHFV